MRTAYLGTRLTPTDFYRTNAARYTNPHSAGIESALSLFAGWITGTVLDLGCGDGLVTRWLRGRAHASVHGVDASPEMVDLYRSRTGSHATVARFSDTLPPCDTAIAAHALHLALPAERDVLWYRLAEAGARTVIVISPFRDCPQNPTHYFHVVETQRVEFGDKGRAVHAWVAELSAPPV